MIPKEADHKVTSNLPSENTTKFTIEATGKAFRVLIDKLYENKALAIVRELCTNAFDAHVAAGNVDKPFDVQLPGWGDPSFRVRDYGISMTHEQVTGLYTTLFATSKAGTNEQVGMLGLGSKSPFALTTTFTVTAYLDGEARVYVAFMDDDGVPNLNHLSTVPSDEPRGIEVSVPVGTAYQSDFIASYQRVALGFDVRPNLVGDQVTIGAPIMTGPGWRLFETNVLGLGSYDKGRRMVRQGCVVYNVSNVSGVSAAPLKSVLIVDVPIGSVEVAASRETLSLDSDTLSNVKGAFAGIADQINAQILADLDSIDSYIDACVRWAHYSDKGWSQQPYHKGQTDRRLQGRLTLPTHVANPDWALPMPESAKHLPIGLVRLARSHGRSTKTDAFASVDVPDIAHLKIAVLPPGEKIVRWRKRLLTWQRSNRAAHLFAAHPERLKPVIEKLELDPRTVFVSIASFPDEPPAKRDPSAPSNYTPRPKVEPPKGLWALRDGQKHVPMEGNPLHAPSYRGYSNAWQGDFRHWAKLVGGPDMTVDYYTEKQAAKMNLDPDKRAEKVIVENLSKVITTGLLHLAIHQRTGDNAVIDSLLFKELGVDPDTMLDRNWSHGLFELGRRCVSDFHKLNSEAAELVSKAHGNIAVRYPLLFPNSNNVSAADKEAATVEYVKMIDGKRNQ